MNGADFKNLDTAITTREKNSCCLLSSGKFAQILNINQNSYDCRLISNTPTQNLFIDPCDSERLDYSVHQKFKQCFLMEGKKEERCSP